MDVYHDFVIIVKFWKVSYEGGLKIGGELRMLAGSRFHSVGAAILKDLSPKLLADLMEG